MHGCVVTVDLLLFKQARFTRAFFGLLLHGRLSCRKITAQLFQYHSMTNNHKLINVINTFTGILRFCAMLTAGMGIISWRFTVAATDAALG
ncbi:hypothetical protein A8A12_17260 [Serratia marcescens]|nr:hypothetical protein A8A12_17260 [Serratia marcescens]